MQQIHNLEVTIDNLREIVARETHRSEQYKAEMDAMRSQLETRPEEAGSVQRGVFSRPLGPSSPKDAYTREVRR